MGIYLKANMTKRHPKFITRLTLVIAALVVLAVIVAIALANNNQAPKASRPNNSSNQQPLTAGPYTVPRQFRAKAESLGYYCPSWNAQPGTASPGACVKLNR